MKEEEKNKLIDDFLKDLESQHVEGAFGVYCLKCGSKNIEQSYDGEGSCVAQHSYTADFNGKHFIKCIDCGNATTKTFFVSLNGICE